MKLRPYERGDAGGLCSTPDGLRAYKREWMERYRDRRRRAGLPANTPWKRRSGPKCFSCGTYMNLRPITRMRAGEHGFEEIEVMWCGRC